MRIVGHAVLDAIVSDDDGDAVAEAGRDRILEWLAELDLQRGDEILVIRGREPHEEAE